MYAKEHIRPKLHQLDQDKLARLYADLRRESLATGSFPITVRHLESMIRMSEASAKMNLREYVRADDIDLAIQVTVGSFVQAQKMSIKKTLERVSRIFLKRIILLTTYRDSGNMSTKRQTMKSSSHSCWASSSRRKSNSTDINEARIRLASKYPFNSSRHGPRSLRYTMWRLSSRVNCSLQMDTRWCRAIMGDRLKRSSRGYNRMSCSGPR